MSGLLRRSRRFFNHGTIISASEEDFAHLQFKIEQLEASNNQLQRNNRNMTDLNTVMKAIDEQRISREQELEASLNSTRDKMREQDTEIERLKLLNAKDLKEHVLAATHDLSQEVQQHTESISNLQQSIEGYEEVVEELHSMLNESYRSEASGMKLRSETEAFLHQSALAYQNARSTKLRALAKTHRIHLRNDPAEDANLPYEEDPITNGGTAKRRASSVRDLTRKRLRLNLPSLQKRNSTKLTPKRNISSLRRARERYRGYIARTRKRGKLIDRDAHGELEWIGPQNRSVSGYSGNSRILKSEHSRAFWIEKKATWGPVLTSGNDNQWSDLDSTSSQ